MLKRMWGVGKINATYNLLKSHSKTPTDHHQLRNNRGTEFNKGSVWFVAQNSYNVIWKLLRLVSKNLKTPFSTDPVILQYGLEIDNLLKGIVEETN